MISAEQPSGLAPGRALMLRTCAADMTSHHGKFQWPREGRVVAPDWDPEPECGGGLHGLLYGCGYSTVLDTAEDAVWVVAEVDLAAVVDLDRKIKVPAATVVYAGSRDGAVRLLDDTYPDRPVVYAQRVTGNDATAVTGDHGTATTGDYGTATAGTSGTAMAGRYGTAVTGHDGTATAGRHGTATAGNGGTATARRYGTATTGDHGNAIAGARGTATAGRWGNATAGTYGTAIVGHGGTATAGDGGTLAVGYYDPEIGCDRLTVGYVGETPDANGQPLQPDVPYKLNATRRFTLW